jgi:hypothetical protein
MMKRRTLLASALGILVEPALSCASTTLVEPKVTPTRKMYHISVGDEDWQPTVEELDKIKELFTQAFTSPKGAIVSTRKGITITEYDAPPSHKLDNPDKLITHLSVGNDEWEPTADELSAVVDTFSKAETGAGLSVTPNGITLVQFNVGYDPEFVVKIKEEVSFSTEEAVKYWKNRNNFKQT